MSAQPYYHLNTIIETPKPFNPGKTESQFVFEPTDGNFFDPAADKKDGFLRVSFEELQACMNGLTKRLKLASEGKIEVDPRLEPTITVYEEAIRAAVAPSVRQARTARM